METCATSEEAAETGGRAVYGVGLRPLDSWGYRFEFL
jgi:hypothetical protein